MKTSHLGILLSSALALLLYAHTLDYDFSYDDRGILVENEDIQQLNWSRLLLGSYWGESGDGLYRPLTMLSYGANSLLGKESSYFHAVNIALHAINVFLLYLSAYRYGGNKRAFWSALCFAANPLLSESVASVVGRAELLSFAFGLTGWIVWDFARDHKNRLEWLLVAGVIFLFSQLAKENGVVFAVAVLLSERRKDGLPIYGYLIPIAACCSGLVLKLWAIGSLRPSVIGFIDNPLAYANDAVRVANGLVIYARYVIKVVYPWHLSIDYSFDQIPVITPWFAGDVLIVLVLLCSTLFFLWRWGRSDRFIARWSAAIGFSLFIVSSIPIASSTLFAERLLYFPVAGFSLLLSGSIIRMRFGEKYFFLTVLVIIYSLLTLERIPVWENDATLFRSAVKTSPNSARSYYGLGLSLHRTGQWEKALVSYEKALKIYPHYADAQYNRAALLLGQKKYEDAYNAYAEVVMWNPGYVKAKRALALIEIDRGQIEIGLERLYELVDERNGAEEAYESLVLALMQLGRDGEAERVLADGLRVVPNSARLHGLLPRVRAN